MARLVPERGRPVTTVIIAMKQVVSILRQQAGRQAAS
jgi:hypothetical protein